MGFFDKIFGDDGGDAMGRGYTQYLAGLDGGFKQAMPLLEKGFDDAQGYLDPYLEAGQPANALYADFVGANGRDAQQTAVDNYRADPTQQIYQQAADRQANAGGRRYSGAAIAASGRIGAEQFQNRLNNLYRLGSQGAQFATASANNAANRGRETADFTYGYNQQRANAHQGYYNATAQRQAQKRTNGVNALSQLGGSAFKLAGAF